MPKNFWEGQVDPDMSFAETQEYLRPKPPAIFKQDLFEDLAPTDPEEPAPKAPDSSLLEEHQIDPQDFAQRALEHPEMWDDADAQFLQDVLEGGETNEDLERLADDFLSGRAHSRAAQLAGGPPPAAEEEDLGGPGEGFDDHIDELEGESIPIAAPFSVGSESLDLSKIDEWWKK